MLNYRLKIDFCDDKVLASDISFVSGDIKSTTLNLEFYNEGKRVDISGYTLSVRAKRSDGVVIASGGKIKENTAVFTPESNMYAVPGELYIEIALADSSGRYATTKVITAEVIEGLGEAATEGVDNLNIYVNLLKDAISAKEAAESAAEIAKSVHPEIVDGVWWVYDENSGEMVSSGVKATGEIPDSVAIKNNREKELICAYTYDPADFEDGSFPCAVINRKLTKDTIAVYVNGVKATDLWFDDNGETDGSFVAYGDDYDMYFYYHSSDRKVTFYQRNEKGDVMEIYMENISVLNDDELSNAIARTDYVDKIIHEKIGDIDTAIDRIIALQNGFIGGVED